MRDAQRIANWIGQKAVYDVWLCATDANDLVELLGGMFIRACHLGLDDAVQLKFSGGTSSTRKTVSAKHDWCCGRNQAVTLM